MSEIRNTYKFTARASFPKDAIALIYDLEGFSRFFNQPDVQEYIPGFLNHISEAISTALLGGTPAYSKGAITPLSLRVVHEKFLGDGALYILQPPKGKTTFTPGSLTSLCNRLWNVQAHFEKILANVSDAVPVVEIPKRIRFGLARGSVFELKTLKAGRHEYIGFCINLASRLQKYCTQLAFIASARMQIPQSELEKHGFFKVVATQLRGFPQEWVIVDRNEFNSLKPELRDSLFTLTAA